MSVKRSAAYKQYRWVPYNIQFEAEKKETGQTTMTPVKAIRLTKEEYTLAKLGDTIKQQAVLVEQLQASLKKQQEEFVEFQKQAIDATRTLDAFFTTVLKMHLEDTHALSESVREERERANAVYKEHKKIMCQINECVMDDRKKLYMLKDDYVKFRRHLFPPSQDKISKPYS